MRNRIVFMFLLLSSSFLFAQEKHPMTFNDMIAMQRVSDPALSPDGKWIVYTLTTPNIETNRNSAHLWIIPAAGGKARRLVDNPANDRSAVWSPDGRWIAFESPRSGVTQIWVTTPEGTETQQVTRLSTGASQAVWSPDSRSIAFVSEVFPEYSSLSPTVSDSMNQQRLLEREQGKVKAQIFTKLLYRHWDHWVEGKRQHIFIQNFPSGQARDLTPGDRDAVPTSSTFSGGIDFAFSPDGKEIAYTATPIPVHEEAWSTNHDIYVVPVTGGEPRQLTTNPAADGTPRYSADGRYIAYRAQSRPGFEADRWQIMLYDRKSKASKSLTASLDAHAGTPVWSPDSKAIYFEADIEGGTDVFQTSVADGTVLKVLDRFSSHDIEVSPDGKRLFFVNVSATRPAELYSAGIDGQGMQQITTANDSLFAHLDVPPAQVIWYQGADGAKIQAWLFVPPKFNPSQKYPFVYMVHGGPQGAWGDSWSYRWNPPLWAAQGYVVMAPNPRGSTGFGQKFVDEISGDWGGKVFIDLMKGVDYAEALPYVDRDRKAAAGASFGGYMMNWFEGNAGNRFRTLISHDGVYNFESMYGSTDEVWFDEWEHGGTPWDKPEGYARYSPHRFAKNFRTPMLVIHGGLDFRIPETEAMQLFTALQRQGVPSQFLYFPDEGHWVLKPQNSRLWHTTVFQWLDKYLNH